MTKDYYNTLGVAKNATQDEIKAAFRRLAHKYHPDKKDGDEKKFKEINEAYQVLSSQEKRRQYDQFGSTFEQAQSQGGFSGFNGFRDFSGYANGFDFEDLGDLFGFGDIFGQKSRTRSRTRNGGDIMAEIEIDFEEAVTGSEKIIKFERIESCAHCRGNGAEPGTKIKSCATCQGSGRITRTQQTIIGAINTASPCPECKGSGKVNEANCRKCAGESIVNAEAQIRIKVPAGINDGNEIKIKNEGHAGLDGGGLGDLYVKVYVKENSKFKREGDDIYTEENINILQAIKGDKITIDTVEGRVNLKIPEGTQSHTLFKLRGRGMPRLQSFGKGDHYVKIIVEIPKNLSKRQKALLSELDL